MNIQLEGEAYSAIDKDAIALLKLMLLADPAQRITAEDALTHPYFCGMGEEEKVSTPVATSIGISRHGSLMRRL